MGFEVEKDLRAEMRERKFLNLYEVASLGSNPTFVKNFIIFDCLFNFF